MHNFFNLFSLIFLLNLFQKGVKAEEHTSKKMYVYTEEPAVVDYHGSDKYVFWLDESGRANVAPQEMYNQGVQGQVIPTFSQQQYAPQMTPANQYIEQGYMQQPQQYGQIQPSQQPTNAGAIIQPSQQTADSKGKEKDSKGSSKDSKSKDDKDSKNSTTASSKAKKNSCIGVINKYTMGLTIGTLMYTFIN